MKKVFKVSDLRKLEGQLNKEEISYSRMVEILNEMACKAYDFTQQTDKDQDKINRIDLQEIALYYGGWKELREVIDKLEENDHEHQQFG